MTEPASIRYRNPGAMWGSPRAKRWGAVDDIVLSDGQKNHIAVFPTMVAGAAAQFDLWRAGYTNMSLHAAIDKWSGHNSPAAYVSFLEKETGLSADQQITSQLLAGPKGLALMKAQAHWEAGKPYPMTDAEWEQAQRMVFSAIPVPVPVNKKHAAAAATVTAGTAAATQATSWVQIAIIAAVVVAVVIGIYLISHRSKS